MEEGPMAFTFMAAPSSMPSRNNNWSVLQWKNRHHPVHQGVTCDLCGESPITGIRYKCLNCRDYDLCIKCETSHPHDKSHVFAKIHTPVTKALPTCDNFYG